MGLLLLLICLTSDLSAQEWNSAAARTLVDRAILRRRVTQADSGLHRYRSRAQGTVLFLAQIGPDPAAAPRVVKADQLGVEVYWEAPNRSKQNIVAWRDRVYLPTDIRYHRDHLGIVTNDFGDAIRLGQGDEVRDVPHPLMAGGPALYDYALTDSLVIQGADRHITVFELQVRPKDAARPLVVGTLYLDTRSAALVRFRFGFTPAAYLERDLEDISVVLESALFEQRYWLPFRQEIEIRRRTAWLDFPFRTIIRGRWEIGEYDLETALPHDVFTAGAYGGLQQPVPGDSGWGGPIDSAVAGAVGSLPRTDLETTRREVIAQLGPALAAAQPPARLAFGSLSELAHVNRVQGLAVGIGATFTIHPWELDVRPSLGYGTGDGRFTGGLALVLRRGPAEITLRGARQVRDIGEWPVISGALNSLLAQEAGHDYGDYVLLDAASATAAVRIGDGLMLSTAVLVEDSRSLATAASPANGSYAANPALGAGRVPMVRLNVARTASSAAPRAVEGSVGVEVGSAGRGYARLALEARARWPLGIGSFRTTLRAGWSSEATPSYRTFVIGGRGTLVGEPFRAFGGRQSAVLRLEWQFPVGIPEVRLGSFATTGPRATLAPFVATGWTSGSLEGLPWGTSDGLRPVVGVASDLLFGVLRLEAGWAVRSGRIGLVVDASPSWWPIL